MKDKYFEVEVHGQYHSLNDVSGTPTLKNYDEKFILPSQEAALSIICKHLLTARLKKVHPDFIRFRTHQLGTITLHNYTPNTDVLQMPIDDMFIAELYDFCILRQIMIDPYKHSSKDIGVIRSMVQKAYTEKRQVAKDTRELKKNDDVTEGDTLRKLNDLPNASGESKININEMKVKRPGADSPMQAPSTSTIDAIEPLDEPLPAMVNDDPNTLV